MLLWYNPGSNNDSLQKGVKMEHINIISKSLVTFCNRRHECAAAPSVLSGAVMSM